MSATVPDSEAYDYVVVGSGAGGGVVAARLAQAGKQVLLLEAGRDLRTDPAPIADGRDARHDYDVPAFHAFASEHPDLRWDFWVHHFDDVEKERRDPKYCERNGGVLYPRASTLGGCTAHHAMIIMRPHNADWNHIAETFDDPSWRASRMHAYFRRIERCRHRALPYRWLARLGWNPTGHGWNGWLTTEKAVPLRSLLDRPMMHTLTESARRAMEDLPHAATRWRWLAKGQGDPNDERVLDQEGYGVRYMPLSTARHRRAGTRELLDAVARTHSEYLTIRTDALATRIVVDRETRRATEVIYREGRRLYGAAPGDGASESVEKRATARAEIVLAAGTFNTPQLLMLSGIGCPEALAKHGIDTVVGLPGVGKNLQDRYEIGVVNRMKAPWKAMRGARFEASDRVFKLWRWLKMGLYKSNGGVLAVTLPSRGDITRPDLVCLAFLSDFRGYERGYARRVRRHDYLSWVVLKAHTNNAAGEVTLASDDPTVRPTIRFRYFEEGSDASGDDLAGVVTGVKLVRRMVDSIGDLVDEEETPGRHLYTDEQIAEHVRAAAWGHHACGTCAMKPRADGGVVDSAFRVHGVTGLRIVDASVLPRIPGFFIVTSVYMMAEKAADAMLGR